MDKRNRPAQHRKRRIASGNMVTISIRLREEILDNLAYHTAHSENKNMSEIIEEKVFPELKKIKNQELQRKPREEIAVKKTFTFTPDFVAMLKAKTNNVSEFINERLEKVLPKYPE